MLKIMVLIPCLTLAACSGSNAPAPVVVQALPQVSFWDAPTYARGCASAIDADIVATSSYKDMSVNVRVRRSDPLVEATIFDRVDGQLRDERVEPGVVRRYLSDAHIVSLTYDQDDVVMYALDGKNDLVYRYADTSGDNVPDASSRSTMVEAGGVLPDGGRRNLKNESRPAKLEVKVEPDGAGT